jgi:DUF1680 family protein
MKKTVFVVAGFALIGAGFAGSYEISNPKMGSVKPLDGFWAMKEKINRTVSCPSSVFQCKKTGRIENFVNSGHVLRGKAHKPFRGAFFNDSDVYKVAEGLVYQLALHPDEKMQSELDDMISKFIYAQEKDGYVFTPRPLKDRHPRIGPHRWYCDDAHELYCMGHMIEAAVAHYESTGKRNFLDMACRAADMMHRTFGEGEGKIWFVPGHEEVELALCKLYLATGEKKYLDVAMTFLNTRGMDPKKRKGVVKRGFPGNFAYYHDHKPVREQREAVGHSVRATYLYSAMCDVGVLADDAKLLDAVDDIWKDMVSSKMHLSGGLGSDRRIEGFGKPYDLPNDSCYLETCAAIGNALFNERMFRRTGDSKYLDIVERVAFNAFPASTSLKGDEFFYPNPLTSSGGRRRQKWFGCACCPPNIIRFIPQFINWTYAKDDAKQIFYWNFFTSTDADLGNVKFSQTTAYPSSGNAVLVVNPENSNQEFTLKIRIPGWAMGRPVPFSTYTQTVPSRAEDIVLTVNGKKFSAVPGNDGFVAIKRLWNKGDKVQIVFPMDVKRIKADERIAANRGRLAVERGPILFCAEGADNVSDVVNAILPADATFKVNEIKIQDHAFVSLTASTGLKLIPYGIWNNRKIANAMQTWFAVDRKAVGANDDGILVTASHCWKLDSTKAVFDKRLPSSSSDDTIPRFTFWPRCGSTEWIEVSFPQPRSVKEIQVYWFDDAFVNLGKCALPAEWKIQYRMFPGLPWEDVKNVKYSTVRNAFSTAVLPKAIETDTFRIKVKSSPKLSSGILEARVK